MIVLSILASLFLTSLNAKDVLDKKKKLSEAAEAACRCAKKFDVCGKTCPIIGDFYEKDDDCKKGTDDGLCEGELALDKTYTEICGVQKCPDEDVKAACRCAKKFNVCGETCPAVADFYSKDKDCQVAVDNGLCREKLPFDLTYSQICGEDVCPSLDPSVKAACDCAAKFDVCAQDCSAIVDFYDEDESCKKGVDDGICGGKFPLDKSYTEICGDLCPMNPAVNAACECAAKFDVCGEDCAAIIPFYNKDASCRKGIDDGICADEKVPLDKSYTEFCGDICPEDKCAKFSVKECRKNRKTCKFVKAQKKCMKLEKATVKKCGEADSKKKCKKIHPGCKWFKRKDKCLVRTQD